MSNSSYGATIAIIDSGTDMMHEMIIPHAWANPTDTTENNRDEDRNGYQDDILGWNFAESNNMVIDYKYLGTLNDDIRKFFKIQGLAMQGSASSEDLKWIKEKIKDEEFLKQLQIYGNFMHGTHVAGIAIKGSSADNKIIAVKLIPTEVKLPGKKAAVAAESLVAKGDVAKYLFKFALAKLAEQQMKVMEEIAAYIDGHQADIANGSFGTGYPQATMIVKTLYKAILKKEPSAEDTKELVAHFFEKMLLNGKKMMEAAPNTLFVFAAGNDGLNNDIYPASPTNLIAENEISVAATLMRYTLASFSNYGAKMVDIAAPGVTIKSAAPGKGNYLEVSGTSQAAPRVANIAAEIKTINQNLNPASIKAILMQTVDVKDFLKGKVKSSGIVNKPRALRAAELSKTIALKDAIKTASTEIADIAVDKALFNPALSQMLPGMVLPLPSSFR